MSVEAPNSTPSLPAAVEVAAYRIVQEALTNVVRHAGARICRVCLAVQRSAGGEVLCLEVVDDGVDLPAERRAGTRLYASFKATAVTVSPLEETDRPGGEGAGG